MHYFGYLLGSTLRFPFVLAMKMVKSIVMFFVAPAVKWHANRKQVQETREIRKKLDEQSAPVDVQTVKLDKDSSTGPAKVLKENEFEVADRIISLSLVPPVGVINMRIYESAKKIKRDLIITEPVLRGLLKGRRHTLTDIPFDSIKGTHDAIEETIEFAEKFINEVGNQRVKGIKPKKEEYKAKPPQEVQPTTQKESEQAKIPAKEFKTTIFQEPQSPVHARASKFERQPMDKHVVESAKSSSSQVFAPKVTKGITYVGILKEADFRRIVPSDGRASFEIFQATLLLENGAELPLRGVELERALDNAGCSVGQKIAITPMGKVPVTLANGNEGSKNLYVVKTMK